MAETPVNTTTLTSLALLRQHIDSGEDYFDYLRPFVEQIFIEEADVLLNAERVKERMLSRFGLEIPLEVIRFVLMRMKRKRYLIEEEKQFIKGPKFEGRDFSSETKDATSQIDEVLEALVQYAASIGRDNFTKEGAIQAIQRFLGKFQIECIQSYLQSTALPKLPATMSWDEGLVGLFVINTIENDHALFVKFMVLVQGNMLANALINTDTGTPPDTFRKTTFYFDTPNLLQALGYAGNERQRLVHETMDILKRLHGRIAVFEHNIEEAEGVLAAVANNVDDPKHAHKPLNTVARQRGWKTSDLLDRKQTLQSDLEALGFKIKQTPTHVEEYQVEENTLESLLKDNVSYDSDRPRTLLCDITSIRSIYVLRQGKRPRRMEDCNAIMVSSNSAVARTAYKFAVHRDGEQGYTCVVGNFTLTNIAWLKAPNFDSNLIDAQAIAQAYSAMRLSSRELQGVIGYTEKLVAENRESYDNLQLLRSSVDISRELALAKAGNKELQDEETISSVVSRIRSTYSAEADETKRELRQEQEAHRQTQVELREARERENTRKERRLYRCAKIRQIAAGICVIAALLIAMFFVLPHFIDPPPWMADAITFASILMGLWFAGGFVWVILICIGLAPKLPHGWITKKFNSYCDSSDH